MDSTNDSVENTTCTVTQYRGIILHGSLPLAIFIILVLSYLSERESRRKSKSNNGCFFSLIYPIDLFDNHDRLPHCLAIGGTTSLIMDLIFGQYSSYFFDSAVPNWASLLVGTLATVEISIDCFPLFGCISSKSNIVAKGLGFMYITAWFVVTILIFTSCKDEGHFVALTRLPMAICFCLLMLYFLGKLIQATVQWYQATTPTNVERLYKTHQAVHVRNLLIKPKEIEYKRWRGLLYKIYKPNPGFTYPNRVLLPSFVSVIGVWNLAFTGIPMGLNLKTQGINILMGLAEQSFMAHNDTDGFNNATEKLSQIDSGLTASWWIASPLAILLIVVQILRILQSYRNDLLSLQSGKYKVPQSMKLSTTDKVVGSMKYIGFQVAVLLAGYIAAQILLFLLLMVPTAVVLLFVWDFQLFFVDGFLKFILPAMIIGLTVMNSETIITKFVFIQDKLKPTDGDKPLAVNHRTAFLIYSYFTMFLNMLYGLIFASIRVISAILHTITFLPRIDQPLWDRDMVHALYVGNLLTENAHSNPILVMFCHLMLYDILKPHHQKQLRTLNSRSTAGLVVNEQIDHGDVENPKREREPFHLLKYFRWHLAYTLINNPSLIELRKRSAIVDDREDVLKNHASVFGKTEGHTANTKLLPHLVQVLKRQESHSKMTDSDTLPTAENPSLNAVNHNLIALESPTSSEFKATLPPSNAPPSQDTIQPAAKTQPPNDKIDPTFFGPGSESNA